MLLLDPSVFLLFWFLLGTFHKKYPSQIPVVHGETFACTSMHYGRDVMAGEVRNVNIAL
jgi:hypothetical protein